MSRRLRPSGALLWAAALLAVGAAGLAGGVGEPGGAGGAWAETFRLDAVPATGGEQAADYCEVADGASFSWEGGRLVPQAGLFSYFPEGEKPLRPLVELPAEVEPGSWLAVLVDCPGSLGSLAVELRGADGGLAAAGPGFPVAWGRSWSALLGVPSTTQSGQYHLVVNGTEGPRRFAYHAEVSVRPRQFATEQIAFNQSLSELMTVPDPRKEEEYDRLAEVLGAFHGTARFHWASLVVPVASARRTSGYADRRLYRYSDGGSSRSLHNGVDLAAPTGTPVVAAGSGQVVLAEERVMTGFSVVLEHLPGVYSLYYHLDSLEVSEGERVVQGQEIGKVGMTGLATGPHLHWELRVSGVAVDPEEAARRPLIDKVRFSIMMKDHFLDEGR